MEADTTSSSTDTTTSTETQSTAPDYIGTATYSPEDNKIRITPFARLDRETYDRLKAAGFKWAPAQKIFVAPMWTPGREDIAEELCGELQDEDKTLAERAEERAERFDQYSDNRTKEAHQAAENAQQIGQRFAGGQPIILGHHSTRKALKDKEKMENAMSKAVKLWDAAGYWERRAAGAIHNAKYKERPDVRARRIKTIETDKRKIERAIAENNTRLKLWTACDSQEKAQRIAATMSGWLRVATIGDRQWTAYDVLRPADERYSGCPVMSWEQVREIAIEAYTAAGRYDRWLAHYENRLIYERAMLAEQGGTAADQVRPEKGGACKCWTTHRGGWSYIQKVNRVSVTVLDNWGNPSDADGSRNFTRTMPMDKLSELMSAADVTKARQEGRLIEFQDKTGFYLSEPTKTPEPEAAARGEAPAPTPEPAPEPLEPAPASLFEQMRQTLKAGIEIVTAPNLFPTPPDVADTLADYAAIEPGQLILEPSAGTGNLIDAIFRRTPTARVVAVEINFKLAEMLRTRTAPEGGSLSIVCSDFLEVQPDAFGERFDVVMMNPPFDNGEDIKHIEHARRMLKPGGRIVAICAAGPRQQQRIGSIATYWEELPAGTFAGTNVRAAIAVIEGNE